VQSISLKIKGLYTYPNQLGKAMPDGALLRADNIVIDAEDTATCRRGFNLLTYPFADVADRAAGYFSYQDKLLVSYTNDKLAYYNSGSGWVNLQDSDANVDIAPAISGLAKVRAAEANQNFYFTTSEGVKKLTAYNGTVGEAGMTPGLDLSLSLNAAGTGFLADDNQVAYRYLWGIKDGNNYIPLGSPSPRQVITNSSGASKDIDIVLTVPEGITTSHFYQIYRSDESGDAAVEPNDECKLVYEGNPTAGEITNGYTATITDQTPNDLRGATLYISPSQEGAFEANEPPPLARDIAEFNGSLFFGDTVSKHRKTISLLATGGSSGILDNGTCTLTIAGTTYTGSNTETISTGTFKVYTSGTASQNIADTAQSLVRVINRYSGNTTVYARYLSSVEDLPGKILIEERGLGGAAFTAVANTRGSAWSPSLASAVTSDNDTFKNAVHFSKNQQPEAVPLKNVFRIGSASKRVLRLVPLKDSLFVLKEDGVWRIIGSSPTDFRVESVDTSTKLLAPESARVLNNQIYALTDQGVTVITETGVQVISRPIEGDLLELFGANLDSVKEYSFGIGYETDRKYILFTVSNASDTVATQAFVYNVFTNTWTRWDLSASTGHVHSADDKLVLGDAQSAYTKQERKAFSYTDHVDESADDYMLVSNSGTTLTLDTVSGIEEGDLIYQSASVYSRVLSVDAGALTVTVANNLSGWSAGSITLYKAIECTVQWPPQTGDNPGVLKNFQEVSVFLRDRSFVEAFLGFKTEVSSTFEEVTLEGTSVGAWGRFAWGGIAWGGSQASGPVRTYVPLEKSRGSELSARFRILVSYESFALLGISVPFEAGNVWNTQ
jgi:hypothetical protein